MAILFYRFYKKLIYDLLYSTFNMVPIKFSIFKIILILLSPSKKYNTNSYNVVKWKYNNKSLYTKIVLVEYLFFLFRSLVGGIALLASLFYSTTTVSRKSSIKSQLQSNESWQIINFYAIIESFMKDNLT